MNPVQIARGIEKTAKALVSELKLMSREVSKVMILSVWKIQNPEICFTVNGKKRTSILGASGCLITVCQ